MPRWKRVARRRQLLAAIRVHRNNVSPHPPWSPLPAPCLETAAAGPSVASCTRGKGPRFIPGLPAVFPIHSAGSSVQDGLERTAQVPAAEKAAKTKRAPCRRNWACISWSYHLPCKAIHPHVRPIASKSGFAQTKASSKENNHTCSTLVILSVCFFPRIPSPRYIAQERCR